MTGWTEWSTAGQYVLCLVNGRVDRQTTSHRETTQNCMIHQLSHSTHHTIRKHSWSANPPPHKASWKGFLSTTDPQNSVGKSSLSKINAKKSGLCDLQSDNFPHISGLPSKSRPDNSWKLICNFLSNPGDGKTKHLWCKWVYIHQTNQLNSCNCCAMLFSIP